MRAHVGARPQAIIIDDIVANANLFYHLSYSRNACFMEIINLKIIINIIINM